MQHPGTNLPLRPYRHRWPVRGVSQHGTAYAARDGDKAIAKAMCLWIDLFRKVCEVLEGKHEVNSLSRLASEPGIGLETLEKCFRYVMDRIDAPETASTTLNSPSSFTPRLPYTPPSELPLIPSAKEPSPPPRKTPDPKPSDAAESIARIANRPKSFSCRPQTTRPAPASPKRQSTASEIFRANVDEIARPPDPSPSPSVWKPSFAAASIKPKAVVPAASNPAICRIRANGQRSR